MVEPNKNQEIAQRMRDEVYTANQDGTTNFCELLALFQRRIAEALDAKDAACEAKNEDMRRVLDIRWENREKEWRAERDSLRAQLSAERDERYYHADGSLAWGHPRDVGHLIAQLRTLDPLMKVSSVTFIDTPVRRTARAYGLSMSRERWDENGWLNFKLPGPECLAIWANIRQGIEGLSQAGELGTANVPDRSPSDATESAK